jgi:hypothetical protein
MADGHANADLGIVRGLLDELIAVWRGADPPSAAELCGRARERLRARGLDPRDETAAVVMLLDVAEVFTVFRGQWDAELFVSWLLGADDQLDGSSPLAVLCDAGPDPLIAALQRHIARR